MIGNYAWLATVRRSERIAQDQYAEIIKFERDSNSSPMSSILIITWYRNDKNLS